mgnify:FL=1
MDLDDFDRQLLARVQADASLTAEQLAEAVALSPSAIQRRLRRLREAGVIEREVAVLDPGRVGSPASFITSLYLHHERPDQVETLRRALAHELAVQQAYYVTGEADYVLVVVAPDVARYEALMAGLMVRHPCIQRYATQVVLAIVKRGLALPL